MSFVHVYPKLDKSKVHSMSKGGDCWCEPKVLDIGFDKDGNPARVFVHENIDYEKEV